MNDSIKLINSLRNTDQNKLPGVGSHKKMAPRGRVLADYVPEPPNAVKSAVLILLYPNEDNQICFPVIRRNTDNSVHSGQISLPGGRYETEDGDCRRTALRETEEEIGIGSDTVDILTKLSPLYIPVSNFTVYPFVGFLGKKTKYVPDAAEVQQVYDISLPDLLKVQIETRKISVRNGHIEAPFMLFGEVEIWGATAMILQEFIDTVKL